MVYFKFDTMINIFHIIIMRFHSYNTRLSKKKLKMFPPLNPKDYKNYNIIRDDRMIK